MGKFWAVLLPLYPKNDRLIFKMKIAFIPFGLNTFMEKEWGAVRTVLKCSYVQTLTGLAKELDEYSEWQAAVLIKLKSANAKLIAKGSKASYINQPTGNLNGGLIPWIPTMKPDYSRDQGNAL